MATGLTAASARRHRSADGSLVGAGSTLVAPLMAEWSADFERQEQLKSPTARSAPVPVSLRSRLGTVDFGASDAPLTPAQASACNSCFQIPWALTATGIAFHLDGVREL